MVDDNNYNLDHSLPIHQVGHQIHHYQKFGDPSICFSVTQPRDQANCGDN